MGGPQPFRTLEGGGSKKLLNNTGSSALLLSQSVESGKVKDLQEQMTKFSRSKKKLLELLAVPWRRVMI